MSNSSFAARLLPERVPARDFCRPFWGPNEPKSLQCGTRISTPERVRFGGSKWGLGGVNSRLLSPDPPFGEVIFEDFLGTQRLTACTPTDEQKSLSKPIGPECFGKAPRSKPFFDRSVLFKTDVVFGVMVPVPDRWATDPFKAKSFRMLPEGFWVGALFLFSDSVRSRCRFWGDGPGARSIGKRPFQSQKFSNASGRVLGWGPFFIFGFCSEPMSFLG